MDKWTAILWMVVSAAVCAVLIVLTVEYQATQQIAIKHGLANHQQSGWFSVKEENGN